jgi:hypothetical protein
MSEFLLLGIRPQTDREVSPVGLARDVAAAAAWHRWLRRWGVLRSFALPGEPVADLRACLIIQVSGHPAATRVAAGWGRVSGYRVTVTPLCDAAAGGGRT